MAKVLLFNGSPHKRGATHQALEVVAKALNGDGILTDEFWIGTKPIAGCIGCYQCMKLGRCVFHDRVQDYLDIAADYDGYVFGSPVHFGGMTGGCKSFLDRMFYSNRDAAEGCFILKPAAVVTSARRAGTTATLEQLEKYLGHQQMITVNSRYWNEVHGNSGDEMLKDEEGVQILQVLGHNMAWLIKSIEAGRAAGIEPPAPYGKRIATNFIR